MATAALYGRMYSSVLLLAAVSLDWYLALVHPLRARVLRGRRLTTGLCLVAWLSAVTLALPLTLQRQTFRLTGSDHMLCHNALPLAEQTSHWRPSPAWPFWAAFCHCCLWACAMGSLCAHWRPVASATVMHSD